MIQFDLHELRQKFYDLGKAGGSITGENYALISHCDGWQRTELLNAYEQGQQDA